MNLEKYKIAFIGFGHLAEIIFSRLVATKMIEKTQCTFIRKNKQKQHETARRLNIIPSTLKKAVVDSEIILFCVPPQNLQEVFDLTKDFNFKNKFLISVLAGTKIQTFEKALGKEIQIMRALPNAPSTIGEGVVAFCFNRKVTQDYKALGMLLFTALGYVVEIDEIHMDTFCGIGSSGPAYVFKLIEAAIQLAVEKGLPYKTSLKIVTQMFIGAAKLVFKEEEIEPLIQAIASPQGTTDAGLKVYDQINLSTKFQDVLNRAIERSEELSR